MVPDLPERDRSSDESAEFRFAGSVQVYVIDDIIADVINDVINSGSEEQRPQIGLLQVTGELRFQNK